MKIIDTTKPAQAPSKSKRRKPGIPVSEVNLLSVAKLNAKVWAENPDITLKWITLAQYNDLIAAFETSYDDSANAAGSRPVQTNELKNLNKKIKEGVGLVKAYVAVKNEVAMRRVGGYLPAFGIVHRSKAWGLPFDFNERSLALEMMVNACQANGFDGRPYGTEFWADIKIRFDTALTTSSKLDSDVSKQRGSKKILKKQIMQVMVALRYLLRANHPNTYKSVFRKWGWMKEGY